jgi:hypothetical protein
MNSLGTGHLSCHSPESAFPGLKPLIAAQKILLPQHYIYTSITSFNSQMEWAGSSTLRCRHSGPDFYFSLAAPEAKVYKFPLNKKFAAGCGLPGCGRFTSAPDDGKLPDDP